jgi:hypothetical protein
LKTGYNVNAVPAVVPHEVMIKAQTEFAKIFTASATA